MKRYVSLSIFAAFSYLGTAFGGDADFKLDYEAPAYKNTQMPSITSCDPKNPASAYTNSSGSQAADMLKLTVDTALTVKQGLQEGDDSEDIDGKATIDTECGEPASFATEKAKDLPCPVSQEFIDKQDDAVGAANHIMACQRGVLTAMGGEVACLKKQIGEAEKAIDSIINSPGGLAAMLKNGQDTFQDRTAQLKIVGDRLRGTGPSNPGLEGAAKALQELDKDLPAQLDMANALVKNIAANQVRFDTLVKQVETAKILDCMNTPIPGRSCIKEGSASTNYPAGAVSPIDHYECVYAQSVDKTGSSPGKEKRQYDRAKASMAYKESEMRASPEFPPFTDAKAFEASFRTYSINTPEGLRANLLKKVTALSGKFAAQFDKDFKYCQGVAAASVSNDSGRISNQAAIDQDISMKKTANVIAFRKLRDQYSMALKAATGKSILVNTEPCEKASAAEQAKCFDAFNSMISTLHTGKVRATDQALGPAALSLTGGANPISSFLGSVAATNDKTRTIPMNCAGIDDCLTRYTAVEGGLKSFVESYPANLTNTLQSTASRIASGQDPRTGQPAFGTANLRTVTDGIAAVKAKLMAALGKMNVDDGLDLDPMKIDAPEKDDHGMLQQNGLRGLVLQGLSPGLPDGSSKGFGDTLKAINKRKTEVKEEQAKLEDYISDLEARKGTCEAERKKEKKESAGKVCDQANDLLKACVSSGKDDPASKAISDWASIGQQYMNTKDATSAGYIELMKSLASKTGETTGSKDDPSSGSRCGMYQTARDKACPIDASLSEFLEKDYDLNFKDKKKGASKNAKDGN